MRLFCFPYAGGGAAMFRDWPALFPPTIDVCAVELPGRGQRLRETPVPCLLALVDSVAKTLRPYLDTPFALFGHSMGGLIVFELARRLRRDDAPKPVQLLISGSAAPDGPCTRWGVDMLSDRELIEKLRELNGAPRKVLDHPELMTLMLPRVRADFTAVDTYVYLPSPPLSCPIAVFGGARDHIVAPTCLDRWRLHTTGHFSSDILPGGHFFLSSERTLLIQSLLRVLASARPALVDSRESVKLAG